MSATMKARVILTAVAALAGVGACGTPTTDTVSPPPAATVASVAVTGNTGSITAGSTVQLVATPRDAEGNALTGHSVTWTTNAASAATVSSTGLVTAVAAGSATITATIEGIAGTTAVNVTLIAIASIAVTAPKVAFIVGDVSQYSAQPKDAQGNPLSGRTVTWASSQPTVATVSATGLVTAVGQGTASITAASEGIPSAATLITVTLNPALVEQRVLAQHGLGIGLGSTVQQSQLYTLFAVIHQSNISGCTALPGGGGVILLSPSTVIPFQIGFYYDAACTHIAVKGTVNSFLGDDNLGNYHLNISAVYTSPTGVAQGNIVLDEQANGTKLTNGQLTGTVYALGTYTSLTGGPTVQFGLNCNNLAGGHNIGVCQDAVVQNFPGLAAAYGSVTTLALDSTSDGTVSLSGTSVLTSGAVGALTLTQPTATSMVITGGTTYGSTVDAGATAGFTLFPPMPTGWTISDAAHDQTFTISLASNTTRNYAGTLKRISTGATLATFALDQSGSGTITYSDGSSGAVNSWIVAQ